MANLAGTRFPAATFASKFVNLGLLRPHRRQTVVSVQGCEIEVLGVACGEYIEYLRHGARFKSECVMAWTCHM